MVVSPERSFLGILPLSRTATSVMVVKPHADRCKTDEVKKRVGPGGKRSARRKDIAERKKATDGRKTTLTAGMEKGNGRTEKDNGWNGKRQRNEKRQWNGNMQGNKKEATERKKGNGRTEGGVSGPVDGRLDYATCNMPVN